MAHTPNDAYPEDLWARYRPRSIAAQYGATLTPRPQGTFGQFDDPVTRVVFLAGPGFDTRIAGAFGGQVPYPATSCGDDPELADRRQSITRRTRRCRGSSPPRRSRADTMSRAMSVSVSGSVGDVLRQSASLSADDAVSIRNHSANSRGEQIARRIDGSVLWCCRAGNLRNSDLAKLLPPTEYLHECPAV